MGGTLIYTKLEGGILLEKAKYPGVDYSDHGIVGDNTNTRPQGNMEEIRATLKKCNNIVEDISHELDNETEQQGMIGPLNNQLKENMAKLTNLLQ